MPEIRVKQRVMVSDATGHHADYVGDGRYVVDWLPGRQLTERQARDAMRIAVAPDRLETEQWSWSLGLTPREARSLVALPVSDGAVPGEGAGRS